MIIDNNNKEIIEVDIPELLVLGGQIVGDGNVTLLDSVSTIEDLLDLSDPSQGDLRLVESENIYYIYDNGEWKRLAGDFIPQIDGGTFIENEAPDILIVDGGEF